MKTTDERDRDDTRPPPTLGSLFDGSGGFPLAGMLHGIAPVWASEIEPFPIRVTTKRIPGMKHYGDISRMNGGEIEPVDIITFGSPCQDMSVAGKRAGIQNGARSNLFFEAIRIIDEMRRATNGRYPRYAVWENVPGAFSSNKGEDFRRVLEALCQIAEPDVSIPRPEKWQAAGYIRGDGYSVGWRVLDAQYWGVPQRRKRIYLVADFGGERADELLFEREGVPRDTAPGDGTRESAAQDADGGAGGSDRTGRMNPWDVQSHRIFGTGGVAPTPHASPDISGQQSMGICYPAIARTLSARYDSSPCIDRGQNIVVHNENGPDGQATIGECAAFMGGQGASAGGIGYSEKQSPTLKAAPSGGNTAPDIVYALQGNGIDRSNNAGCSGAGWAEDACYTINTSDRHAVAFDCRNAKENAISGTLQAKPNGGHSLNYLNPVVYPIDQHQQDARFRLCDEATAPTLSTNMGTGGNNTPMLLEGCAYSVGNGQLNQISMSEQSNTLDCMHDKQAVITDGKPPRKYIIRRLTPTECARLQGFPDWWCKGLETPNPTADEIARWREVFKVWDIANGKSGKPKTDRQIIKWLREPYSDSKEYKLWGNGVALPCAEYVIGHIAHALRG